MSFRQSLAVGQAGESAIAQWLRRKGFTVLPVYEKIMDTGKGPQLFLPGDVLIAPDMLVFKSAQALWIEAKHKHAFTWYRTTGSWQTGIDLRHYGDYLRVDDSTPWPVWLLFLHRGGQAKDSPPNSPAGLFGEKLAYLRQRVDHESPRHGPSGMVYWNHSDLKLLATLDEVGIAPVPSIREQRPLYMAAS